MKGTIALNGMEFHSFHGVYDYEKEVGNNFRIDVAFEVDLEKAATSDDIADTLDYVVVYEEIAAVMDKPVNLLERLAYQITEQLMVRFPQALSVEILIAKEAPPVGGICKESVVTLRRER